MSEDYQLKISFNPNLSKQVWEVIFSCKSSRVDHPAVTFNNYSVVWTSCQKHLDSDQQLNFSHHIKENISKACKGISVIKESCTMFFLGTHY